MNGYFVIFFWTRKNAHFADTCSKTGFRLQTFTIQVSIIIITTLITDFPLWYLPPWCHLTTWFPMCKYLAWLDLICCWYGEAVKRVVTPWLLTFSSGVSGMWNWQQVWWWWLLEGIRRPRNGMGSIWLYVWSCSAGKTYDEHQQPGSWIADDWSLILYTEELSAWHNDTSHDVTAPS